jgi:hypothetical protein
VDFKQFIQSLDIFPLEDAFGSDRVGGVSEICARGGAWWAFHGDGIDGID